MQIKHRMSMPDHFSIEVLPIQTHIGQETGVEIFTRQDFFFVNHFLTLHGKRDFVYTDKRHEPP